MPELGLIDAGDVKQLSDEQLTKVCNDLILFELRQAGLPPVAADLTQAITVADGGLDALVKWEGGPETAGSIPSRNTGFQYKATAMGPTQCGNELRTRDGTDLKPAVRRLLEARGTYILISGANDINSETLEERLAVMRGVVREYLGDGEYALDVWGAQTIANWICTYLPALAYVSSCVGRPYAPDLRSFQEWSEMKAYRNAYVRLPSEQALFQNIVDTLSQPGRSFRLDGLPGLGKSRLALETVRQIAAGTDAAYINVARQSIADQLFGLIVNWKRRDVRGVLVVDNCPPDLHERISDELDDSTLSVLTIDYNPTRMYGATSIAHLGRRSPDDIRAIVQAEYAGAFSAVGLERIVARADGWPLIALRLAEGFREHGDLVENAPEETLMTRILGIDENDRDARRVIRTLSLFEHVGFEAPYQDHLEYIRTSLCQPMDRTLFDEIVQGFRQRGILVEVGSLLRVTPPPMAVQLAAEWIQSYPGLRDRLFDEAMPQKLVEYFCLQFEHLDTVPEAREIAGKLLAAGGLIGNFEALKTRRGARIFRALSKVDPAAATATLVRVLLPLSREDLLQYTDGRRDVIWALEQLVYPSDLFPNAARVLATLAAAENESISNNATGVLRSKFVFIGAQTEAPGEMRLQFLDDLIASSEDMRLSVAAKCIAAGLSPVPDVARIIEPPQMGRPVAEWMPTSEEGLAYRDGLLARAKRLSDCGGEAANIVRDAIASSIRTFVASGWLEELDDLIRYFNRTAPQPWKRAVEELQNALKYEARDNAKVAALIEALLAEIFPRSLAERVRLLVSDPPVDFEEREGNFVDRSAERAENFAAEVARNNQVDEVLPLVVRGSQQKGIEFGRALANASDFSNDVIAAIIGRTADVPADEQNIGPLAGALSALATHDRTRYERALTALLENEHLRGKVALVVAIVRPTDKDLVRLIEALRANRISSRQFEALAYGGALDGCSPESVEQLLDALHDIAAYNIEYFIAGMQKVGHPDRRTAFDPYVKRAILQMDIVRNPLNGIHDWSVIEDAKHLLGIAGNEDLAESIAVPLFAAAQERRDFHSRQRLSEFVHPLFGRYRGITWPLLLQTLEGAQPVERYWLLHVLEYLPQGATERRSVLDDVEVPELLAACRRYSDFLPQYVAGSSALFRKDERGELQPTEQALMLVEHFSDDEGVRSAILSNIMSFGSVGPRAPYYRERIRFVERLPDYGNPQIRAWLEEMRTHLHAIADEQAKRDVEFQEGAW